jgi:prepilin-type N-terminal cleavage/methylation domain-containing protein
MKSEISQSHVASSPRRRANEKGHEPSRRARNHSERGFTLIELLIVVTIIPLIIGALASGLITVFSLQSSVSNRLGDTSDAQVVAASFTKDVQSASSIETTATPLCGPTAQTQLLGLEWGGTSEAASYVEQLQTGTTAPLVPRPHPPVRPHSRTTFCHPVRWLTRRPRALRFPCSRPRSPTTGQR